MFRSVFAATLISALAFPAFAQEHQGQWNGEGEGILTLDLTHLQDDVYGISINTIVPIQDGGFGGCAGGIDGEVALDSTGGNFFVENEGYISGEPESPLNQRYCEIGLTFNEDGTLNTEERGGCLYYHGAACGFSGTLDHEASGL